MLKIKSMSYIYWRQSDSIHFFISSLIRRSIKPKQIGRAPILGRPRLFGGKLLDYIQVTEQPIPLIISSCVSAINRLGLHNQVCSFFVINKFQLVDFILGYFSCTRCTN